MRKESLKVLGIEVSRDLPAKELFRLSNEELMDPQVAYKVSVLREFCEEFYETSLEDLPPIQSPTEAVAVLSPHLRYLDHEECWVVLLNRANKILSKHRMSSGTVSACQIDVARIAKMAIIEGATGVILAHNHPSGNPKPGLADINETSNLKKVLNTLSINLLDHIIFADGRYFSFAEDREFSLKE